jgi:uncharacterized C2H2 Zn-finger protein
MEQKRCPKCGVVLHGSKKWIEKTLAKPCEQHTGNGSDLWQ